MSGWTKTVPRRTTEAQPAQKTEKDEFACLGYLGCEPVEKTGYAAEVKNGFADRAWILRHREDKISGTSPGKVS